MVVANKSTELWRHPKEMSLIWLNFIQVYYTIVIEAVGFSYVKPLQNRHYFSKQK